MRGRGGWGEGRGGLPAGGGPFALLLVGIGCSGDLFHDTSWADGSGGAAASSGSAGGEGQSGTGGGGGASPGCADGLSPLDDGCAIDEGRGYFVRLEGTAGATGTRDDPFATLEEGLSAAADAPEGRRSVFVCAQTFPGPVEVPAGVALVGGLACGQDGWPLTAGERTRIDGQAGTIPLRLLPSVPGRGETRVERMHVVSADAEVAGGSSIAVIAVGVPAQIRDSVLEAGRGADGALGLPGELGSIPLAGLPGSGACTNGFGGGAGAGACLEDGERVDTSGGEGGRAATDLSAGDGGDGVPSGGAGGEGQTSGLGWSCNDEGNGEDGGSGADGAAGAAAPAEERGALGPAGFTPVPGGPGLPGGPGRGGGGGGAARGVGGCALGPGGGGGGAGGCGGGGGGAGAGGGASLALVSVDAPIRLVDSRLVVGPAGDGGDGGEGAPGRAGGDGGPGGGPSGGTASACRGGDGGDGGDGGPGGGGRGGHVVGVAWSGIAPVLEGSTVERPDAGGSGGLTPGGQPAADGESADVLEIP